MSRPFCWHRWPLLLALLTLGAPGPALRTATAQPPAPLVRRLAPDAPLPAPLQEPAAQEALLDYARQLLRHRLGYAPEPSPPAVARQLQRPCFVTFFAGRQVIACFGGFSARQPDLAREIAAHVADALRLDVRARKIDRQAALRAGVQLTFPGEPRPLADYRQLDPAREGLFVENERQGIVIVPGEAKTAAYAYRQAMRRLGETDPGRVRLQRFAASLLALRGAD